MSNVQLKMDQLNKLDPVRLVDDPSIKESFINTYSKIHKVSEDEAESVYNREALYYRKSVSADERLKSCTKLSLYSAFLEIAVDGLSIQPGSKSEAYLEGRGTKQGDSTYINTAWLRVTAYGELNLRIRSGQIKRMFNPIVVYEGDHFQPTTNDRGELIVEYRPLIPRNSKKIIGCFVRILLPDGTSDYKWLLDDDIERLKKFATTKTRTGSHTNQLYTSENGGIDPGFLEAKTIKHAMRAYTKLRVGENVAMDDEEEIPQEQANVPFGPEEPVEEQEAKQPELDPEEPF